jgi:pullulanase/glycogen debranching enzyme
VVLLSEEVISSGDRQPDMAWHEAIVYESRVMGISRGNPDLPRERRATSAGLAGQPIVGIPMRLDVAVELLSIHECLNDKTRAPGRRDPEADGRDLTGQAP